jgi:uncharacterized protein YbjT (DUF2867 family)
MSKGNSKNKVNSNQHEIIKNFTTVRRFRSCRKRIKGVISTVGLWRENPPATFDSVDRQGNINLFETAIQQGVKKAVYVSLLNTEKAKKAKVMLAKRAVERFLEDSDLNYTIFRPSGLFHDFVEVFNLEFETIRPYLQKHLA